MQPAEPPPPLVLPPLWLLLPLPLLLLLQQLLLQLPSGALGIRKRAPEEERALRRERESVFFCLEVERARTNETRFLLP